MKTIITTTPRRRRGASTARSHDKRSVGDLMTKKPLVLDESDSLAFARQAMLWGGFRHLPVAREGRLVGVLSDRELVAAAHANGAARAGAMFARDVMRHGVVTARSDDTIADAIAKIISTAVGSLVVVGERGVIGILTLSDLLADPALSPRGPVEVRRPGVTAQSLMTRDPATVHEDDTIFDVAARMAELGVRHLPVIDSDGALIGMVSDRDVRALIGVPRDALSERSLEELESLRVAEVMTPDPIRVALDASVEELADVLSDERIGAVPVVDDREHPVGIVSIVDVLAYLTRH